jgi:ribonuclease HI
MLDFSTGSKHMTFISDFILVIKFILSSIVRLLDGDCTLSKRVTVNFGVSTVHRPQEKPTNLFVDGSVSGDKAGIGIWCRKGHPLNFTGRITGAADNNRAELAAVYWALLIYPRDQILSIFSDSRYVLNLINGMTHPDRLSCTRGARHRIYSHLKTDASYSCANGRLLKRVRWLLKMRTAPTIFRKIQAHKGHIGASQSSTKTPDTSE